jgi:hypothetical protein
MIPLRPSWLALGSETVRRTPGGYRKTRILDAANEIFVRRGTDGARMQEIAERMQLTLKFRDKFADAGWFARAGINKRS